MREFGIIGGGAILATIGGLSTLSVLAPAAGIGVIGKTNRLNLSSFLGNIYRMSC